MIVPSLSAQQWNVMIDRLIAMRILSVTVLDALDWRHPWNVVPVWNADRSRWEASIRPGFVNGREAVVELPFRDVPAETRERLALAGEDPFVTDRMDAYLTEKPRLPLGAMRAIGRDGAQLGTVSAADGGVRLVYEQVPPFFVALGVGVPPNVSTDGDTLVNQITGELNADTGTRLLRACDLVLYMDREAAHLEVTVGTPAAATLVDYNVVFRKAANAREHAYIRPVARYVPLPEELAPFETRDAYKLATVYLVSPENVEPGSDPDGAWSPHVKHEYFWNLCHRTNAPDPELPKQVLTLNTGLAGGVGDLINSGILATNNDATNGLNQLLRNTTISSRLWTA